MCRGPVPVPLAPEALTAQPGRLAPHPRPVCASPQEAAWLPAAQKLHDDPRCHGLYFSSHVCALRPRSLPGEGVSPPHPRVLPSF